jgi:subtilase family serine protease
MMRENLSVVCLAALVGTLSIGTARAQQTFATPDLTSIESVASPGDWNGTSNPPFTPAQICQAYGINSIKSGSTVGDGAGETIAIVDAYNALPDALGDLNTFSSQFGLTQFNGANEPTFTQIGQTGGAAPSPVTNDWGGEEALDIEWAHAIAPDANIELIEANSASSTDLLTGVLTARGQSGVSVVSMSFGATEASGSKSTDSDFTTPTGHQGITYLASSGDQGSSAGVNWPASSTNVVGVGGTHLVLNSNNSISSETGWVGSGGGVSNFEIKPTYQSGVSNLSGVTNRSVPDVSFDADANTGVYVYEGSGDWYEVGGTSLSSPCWAGLVAITDQLRATDGLGSLDGATQTLPALYSLPAADFNDITSGSSTGLYTPGSGYDMVTGLGTPVANKLVNDLAFGAIPEPATCALLIGGALLAFRRRR